ncbi:hypothetical protein Ciccas_014431 [Cichlidogyrus casuarinus]|uniref:C3H1-type domain-containing protein n=1 Tax=Cichlidogyrus casuarinus TaxID=1844966 RepID=A0ABD2PJ99_9PLAT
MVKKSNICKYFNADGGCWFGNSCKYLHILNKKPQCKYHLMEGGCRFGGDCHFSHDEINIFAPEVDRNNNSMALVVEPEIQTEEQTPDKPSNGCCELE